MVTYVRMWDRANSRCQPQWTLHALYVFSRRLAGLRGRSCVLLAALKFPVPLTAFTYGLRCSSVLEYVCTWLQRYLRSECAS